MHINLFYNTRAAIFQFEDLCISICFTILGQQFFNFRIYANQSVLQYTRAANFQFSNLCISICFTILGQQIFNLSINAYPSGFFSLRITRGAAEPGAG